MDPDSWRLKLLWKWPQLPKRKIKLFLMLGDKYRAKGEESLAKFCYQKSLELANNIKAIHFIKKIEKRI